MRTGHDTRDPLLGAEIDGLRFDSVLGRGMTGCVYRATQLALDRPLAIKVPTLALVSDPVAVRRFRREAVALARVSHPGVVAVHAVGDLEDGRPYLAIEFLDGHSLEQALATSGAKASEPPMPRARAVDLALQIAEALAEVHARDLVHRDLKPDNVMLVKPQVGGDRAVLIDFGLALPVANPDATRLTAGGGLVGTPHYMAPEQVQGDDIDGRADIYSLGATLYRLLTGRVPFDGTGVEVVVAQLARSVPPIRELAPQVSPALEAIVMRCLAKRVSDRWPTAAELAHALADVDPVAGAPARSPRARRVSNLPPLAANEREVAAPTDTRFASAATPPRATGRAVAVIAAIAIVGAGAAFAIAYRGGASTAADRGDGSGSVAAGGAPISGEEPPPGGAPASGSSAAPDPDPQPTRALVVDDGGLSMRVVVPQILPVGLPVRFAFEIWDGDGAPVTASEIVVTVEDEHGAARGFTATRAGLGRSVFAFTTRFATVGRYTLRVFPPVGDATFVVDIDVSPT